MAYGKKETEKKQAHHAAQKPRWIFESECFGTLFPRVPFFANRFSDERKGKVDFAVR